MTLSRADAEAETGKARAQASELQSQLTAAVGREQGVRADLENCQQADGSVVVPEALRPYMDGRAKID